VRGLEETAILQQEGASAHYVVPGEEYLDTTNPVDDRLEADLIRPGRPNLTRDNSLWGTVKKKIS
jgi:hypothetical protein